MKRLGTTLVVLTLSACGSSMPQSKPSDLASGANASRKSTFADDFRFLEAHGHAIVLQAPGGGRVAVSARYQGRVMTSSFADDGPSLGWVNHAFIESK
jgi:hypothetical protein